MGSVFRRMAWTALAASGIFCAATVPGAGQTATAPPGKSTQALAKTAHHAKRVKRATAAKAEPAPVAAPPVVPQPHWPVNDQARPASVSWNGRDLSIAAANSSLSQILAEISTATGLRVEGQNGDQRIYGSYGPAPARDVLSQLLQGLGYNVLMIGDRGEGTPRELVLTAKTQSVAPPPRVGALGSSSSDDDLPPDDPEPADQQPQQEPPMQRRPVGVPGQPGGPGRFPPGQQQQLQQQQTNPPQTPQTPNN